MKLYYKEEGIRVYNGDCKNMFKNLPDKSIRLIFADPPYGINLEYDSPFIDTPEYYLDMTNLLLTEGLRVAETMVITPGGYTNVEIWKQICREKKIDWFRFCWYKGAMPHRSKVGFAHWEEVLIFGKMYAGIPDYLYIAPEGNKQGHACPKPVGLPMFFIDAYTKENDLVYDPFLGSGTTLIACKMNNRKGIGTELSLTYSEICAKRISETMRFGKDNDEIFNQTDLFRS